MFADYPSEELAYFRKTRIFPHHDVGAAATSTSAIAGRHEPDAGVRGSEEPEPGRAMEIGASATPVPGLLTTRAAGAR
jgi:hypothetical protein